MVLVLIFSDIQNTVGESMGNQLYIAYCVNSKQWQCQSKIVLENVLLYILIHLE